MPMYAKPKVAESDRTHRADSPTFTSIRFWTKEDPDVDAAWDQEIHRRVGAIESGTGRLVSAAEVHAQARKLFRP